MIELPERAKQIFHERNKGSTRIDKWEIIEESPTVVTYKVTFTEVVMGVKGRDTDIFDVQQQTTRVTSLESTAYDPDRDRYYDPEDYGGFPSHW